MKIDFARLEAVIRTRVQLGSTRRALEQVNIFPEDFVINKRKVLNHYKSLDDKNKGRFANLIGGQVNYNLTKKYLETL